MDNPQNLSQDQLVNMVTLNSIAMANLMRINESLSTRNKELEKDKKNFNNLIEDNNKLVNEHKTNIDRLTKENEDLNKEIKKLKEEIKEVRTNNEKFDATSMVLLRFHPNILFY